MDISDRGLLYPILGLVTASATIGLYQLFSGSLPGLISIAHLYLVGLGAGLVLARIGRVGPFGGVLGTPWYEGKVEDVLNRETARARQYGRDLTVAAIKPVGKSKPDLRALMRSTDQLLPCRDGWNLIIMPETDAESAWLLMRQFCSDQPVLVTQVAFDAERPRQRLGLELIENLRSARQPEIIALAPAKAPEPRALAS